MHPNRRLKAVAVDSMKRIFDVVGDLALFQILCHFLCGYSHGTSFALPNGQLRMLGMRCVLRLLRSCQQVMVPHRGFTRQWRAQFQLDVQHEAQQHNYYHYVLHRACR